jgi:hypothetical protein
VKEANPNTKERTKMNKEQSKQLISEQQANTVLQGDCVNVMRQLESLTTVEKGRGLTDRFVRRVGKLASDFGIQLSEKEIRQGYQLRSEVAHGRSFLYDLSGVLPQSEHRPLYDKLESLLRVTVKTCLVDENFGLRFTDNQSVLKNYP